MLTHFLTGWNKGLFFEDWNNRGVPYMYIYIYIIHVYDLHVLIYQVSKTSHDSILTVFRGLQTFANLGKTKNREPRFHQDS